MAKDKRQRWAVRTPDGYLLKTRTTRSGSIAGWCDEYNHWRKWKRRGYRCIKVWVYEEPRPAPLPPESAATLCSHCGAEIPAYGVRFVVPSRPSKFFCCYKCYITDGLTGGANA